MPFNNFPLKYKSLDENQMWDEIKLRDRVYKLKFELAYLAKIDAGITVGKALEKIVADSEYSDKEKLDILNLAIDRLKLINIKDYSVRRYLPRYFKHKNSKPKMYIPDIYD